MENREILVVKVRGLLREAKVQYGTWEKTAAAIGITLKSLYRYLQDPKGLEIPILPSLETYEMICRSVGRHCYPPEDGSDGFLFQITKESSEKTEGSFVIRNEDDRSVMSKVGSIQIEFPML